MLQSIRDHTQGWIAGVIVSLLILSFALWGIHSYIGGNGSNDVVAKVNNIDITKSQLSVTYERMKRQLQLQMNMPQLPIQAESAIKERALQSLIETQVLKQASIDAGYRISLIQSQSFLQNLPDFQENGKFSPTKFRTLIESNLYNASDFLELIRTTLLIDQPRLGMILTSYALPNEVEQAIALINQERDLSYAIVPLELVKHQPVNISDNQIKAYYDKHQDDFKTPEQVTIDYVSLTFADILPTIKPTEEALRQFYNETSGSYTIHEASQADKTPGKAVTGLQSFEQVKDKVTKAYIQQKAEEKFSELREKLANMTYEHPESLDLAANELGLKIQTSGAFTRDQNAKDLTGNQKIRDAAFSEEVLMQHNNSDLIQVNPETAVVLRVKTHKPATFLTLVTVKKQIIDKLTAIDQELKVEHLAGEIKQKLTGGLKPEQLSTQYQLTWNKIGFVNRNTKAVDSSILKAAFSMPKPAQNKPIYSVVKAPSGYVIVAVKGFHNGVVKPSDNQYKAFAEQLQNSQGLTEYDLYKESLLHEAKIKMEE